MRSSLTSRRIGSRRIWRLCSVRRSSTASPPRPRSSPRTSGNLICMFSSPQGIRRAIARFLLSACILSVTSAGAQRLVFAHYMLANQDIAADTPSGEANIAAYQQEIQQAQSIGIDGFALNAGGWSKEPRYIRRASEIFEAAYRLHTNFRLMFSADMCCSNDAADVLDMVRR